MPKKDAAIKKVAAAAQAAVNSKAAAAQKSEGEVTKKAGKGRAPLTQTVQEVVSAVESTYSDYIRTLTPRLKLIDTFLVFLVLLGVLQFVYVLLIGNFPFNAFLGGFISCVGQFVLTVSLRLQYREVEVKSISEKSETDGEVSSESSQITPERAFGDYIFASLILHFIVYHFIN